MNGTKDMAAFEAAWQEAGALLGAREYGAAREVFVRCVELAPDLGWQLSSRALVARMDVATGAVERAREAIDGVAADLEAAQHGAASTTSGGGEVTVGPKVQERVRKVEALITREEGAREAATEKFIALYQFCLAHELYSEAIDAAHHVALAGDLEQQITWAHRGIEAAERGDEKGWLAVLWNNLGATLEDAGRLDEALDAYMKARDYHYATGGPIQKLIADWAVGHTQRLRGDLSAAREWLRAALDAAEQLHAGGESTAALEWVAYGRHELGLVTLAEGDRAAALVELEEARTLWREAGLESWKEGTADFDAVLTDLRAD